MQKIKTIIAPYKNIIREGSYYIFSQIIIQICSLVNVLVVSRYLGPTSVGLYSFVQSYMMSSLVIIGGMDFFFSYELAKSENKIKTLKTYLAQRFYLSLLVLVPAIIGAYVFLPQDVFLMILSSFASFVFLPFSVFIIYTQVEKQAKVIAVAGSVASIFSLLIKLVLVYFKMPLIYFTAVAGFDVVVGAIVLLFYYLKNPEWRSIIFSKYDVKFFSIFPFIYKMRYGVVFSIAWQMLMRIDQLLLPALKDAYSLGIYSAAVKISEVPNVLAGIIYITLLSRVVPLIESKTEIANLKIRKIFWIYLLAGVSSSIFIVLLAPVAVSILYGVKFAESVPILRIYALSIPFMFLCFYYHSILAALDKKKLMATVYVVCAILNVALVIFLTKYLDLYGTALATVITYGLAVTIFWGYLKLRKTNL